ncbi:signal recognition particle protein [Saccharophagus degradans]|uniref:Signal recognition particle protein n=1 Tax=Saccharophagus degradans TaxID=86304 RepID=A0AAW7X5Q0_9GAMM|nr:signal recognition particle protein [Saccharophagus degradans]MBU2984325.1 signal recognition particle protein [Saccharophagus degradans]MDO6422912.1 signal recognition particle protein [Saccharophagus degradans]MDO6607057.1 signal recognition particle protein [Saccharophagus degradans]
MFENLSDRLSRSFKKITGKARLNHDNIKDALSDVRKALLEADVALPVVKEFTGQVRKRAQGQEVSRALNPGQQFLKIVESELTQIMGEANEKLNLAAQPPAVVLMAGLQGAGKTTSVAKLARFLREREKKKVMVVSADVYRPAAIKQLETLATEVEAEFFPSDAGQNPVDIAKNALAQAKKLHVDVLLVDTAGRLHVDEALMEEIQAIHAAVNPIETLFVIDAMIGQDAVNTAKAFNEALPLTGVILTKTDGDARGGAALSVRHVTGKPIKFLGVGEKTEALEPFHPDRLASRILGMGDIMSLIEEAEQKIDKVKAEKLVQKVQKGKSFDLEDLRDQLQQMQNMGGMASMLDKLPGMGGMAKMAESNGMTSQFKQMQAIIDSMTPAERKNPDVLNGSRKRRITMGSGTQIQDLNRLLKQHKQMSKMMKKMKGGGMQKMMRGMGGMLPGGGSGGVPPMGGGGGLPPGFGS